MNQAPVDLSVLIQTARGEVPADLLLANARVVNVFSGQVEDTAIAIAGARIIGLGDYAARTVVDLGGRYVCPGLIDAHVHIESAMVPPYEFARAVAPRGVTTVVTDPHEIANVLGAEGIAYMLEASRDIPLDVFVMAPSCVPATRLETSGAALGASELARFRGTDRVLGLAEVMDYPGVIHRDPAVLDKLRVFSDRPIDGHAPGLSGRDLQAYVAAGVASDHECTTLEEAREKLRLGMYIMIREASNARNLRALLPLVTPATARRVLFATDDRTPQDLLDAGSVDHLVRLAIHCGLDPITAIQLATLNAAECFGLSDRGAIAPGRRADLVVLDDLGAFRVDRVFHGGRLVASGGQLVSDDRARPRPPARDTMNVDWDRVNLRVPAGAGAARRLLRVIEVVPDQIVTREVLAPARIEHGAVIADPARDIAKIAVIERHHATGNVGLGFVRGLGLARGALASSVAHDAHNLIVVGANDDDMVAAARAVAAMGGGLAAVDRGEVLARVPLPIAGLMSDRPIEALRAELDRLDARARALGCGLDAPFMALSFLALPVIPELKLTDKGLVDVRRFDFVALWADEARARTA